MKDFISIGPCPAEETPQQVGTPNYDPIQARRECEAYRAQLRKQFGPEPEGAKLAIKSFAHDFGTYMEVVCYCDDDIRASVEYAMRCEGKAWTTWRYGRLQKVKK